MKLHRWGRNLTKRYDGWSTHMNRVQIDVYDIYIYVFETFDRSISDRRDRWFGSSSSWWSIDSFQGANLWKKRLRQREAYVKHVQFKSRWIWRRIDIYIYIYHIDRNGSSGHKFMFWCVSLRLAGPILSSCVSMEHSHPRYIYIYMVYPMSHRIYIYIYRRLTCWLEQS